MAQEDLNEEKVLAAPERERKLPQAVKNIVAVGSGKGFQAHSRGCGWPGE